MKVKHISAAALGFLVGGLLLVWWLSPRLSAWLPEDGIVSKSGSIGLTFTRPVAADEVATHLMIEPDLEGEYWNEANNVWFQPDDGFEYNQRYTVTLSSGVGSSNRLQSRGSYSKEFRIREPELFFLDEDAGVTNLWQHQDNDSPMQFTSEPEGIWDYNFSHDGLGILVSTINREGSDDLVRIGAEGQRDTILECVEVRCWDGRRQPRGQLIAFEQQLINDDEGVSEVWLLDTVTGSKKPAYTQQLARLTGFDSLESKFPRWSSDGQYLAYFKPDAGIIIIQPMSGAEPILIPANLQLLGEWSPMRNQIAYIEQVLPDQELTDDSEDHDETRSQHLPAPFNHLVVANIESGEVIDMSEGEIFDDGLPAWSPDGSLLAVPRDNGGGGRQIWIVDPNRRQWSKISDDLFYHYSGISWSPDGNKLALMRIPVEITEATAEVHILNIESGEMELISKGAFLPGWQP